MSGNFNPKLSSNWIFIDPEQYINQKVAEYAKSIISSNASLIGLDNNMAHEAYNEKLTTDKFFNHVINLPAFSSNDDEFIKSMFKTWYVSFKTELSKLRKIKNYNNLTIAELNEFILSFGYPYANNIPGKSAKIAFLNNVIELYQKKGTLKSLETILKLYNLRNVTISEWWIKYGKTRLNPFYAQSKVIYPENKRGLDEFSSTMEYNEFLASNPFWKVPLNRLNSAYFNKKNRIKLPSLTSAISIDAYANVSKLNPAFAIFQRKFQETYDYWISHTLVPFDTPNNINIPDGFIFNKTTNNAVQTISVSNTDINQSSVCIKVYVTNRPPKLNENDLYTSQDMVIPNHNYYYYIVGPNPVVNENENAPQILRTVWSNADNRKKLVRIHRNGNVLQVKIFNETDSINDFLSGSTFYTDSDSPLYKNCILKYGTIGYTASAPSSITITQTVKNTCIIDSITPVDNDTYIQSMVYNGDEWTGFGKCLPPKESNKIIPNYRNYINRNISLNNFRGLYSLFEIITALSYAYFKSMSGNISGIDFEQSFKPDHDVLNADSAKKLGIEAYEAYYYYNGEEANPGLDNLYNDWQSSNDFVFPNTSGVLTWPVTNPRTDTDSIVGNYDGITTEYENLTNPSNRNVYENINTPNMHISPYHTLMQNRKNYILSFSKILNPYIIYEKDVYNEVLSGVYPQKHPETFLKMVNPDLWNDLNRAIDLYGPDKIVEQLLTDLENYAKNVLELSHYSFSHIMIGGTYFINEIKAAIDFFKPFRTHLLDFQTKFLISDGLNDDIVYGNPENDNIDMDIDINIIEKPFPTIRPVVYNSEYGPINQSHLYDHGFFTENLTGVCIMDSDDGPDIEIDLSIFNKDSDETNRIIAYPTDVNDLPDNNNWEVFNQT